VAFVRGRLGQGRHSGWSRLRVSGWGDWGSARRTRLTRPQWFVEDQDIRWSMMPSSHDLMGSRSPRLRTRLSREPAERGATWKESEW